MPIATSMEAWLWRRSWIRMRLTFAALVPLVISWWRRCLVMLGNILSFGFYVACIIRYSLSSSARKAGMVTVLYD